MAASSVASAARIALGTEGAPSLGRQFVERIAQDGGGGIEAAREGNGGIGNHQLDRNGIAGARQGDELFRRALGEGQF